jgi:hypothetical protein
MDRLPVVTLSPDPSAPAGDVRVAAAFSADAAPMLRRPGSNGAAAPGDVPAAGSGQVTGSSGAGRGDPTLVFRPEPHPTVRATLLVREPGGRSRTVLVAAEPLVVGRDPGCGLVLDDRRVSRQHVRIASRGGFLVLADLGSTNGTYLRDERITEVALGLGDVVTLGDSTIELRPPTAMPTNEATAVPGESGVHEA